MINDLSGQDTLVFIPTYNDVKKLGEITTNIRNLLPDIRILIVDDGSSPAVQPQNSALDILYARLPANFGLGVCTHVALEHALSQNCKAVISGLGLDSYKAALSVLND